MNDSVGRGRDIQRYGNFLIQVKKRIRSSQYEALRAVNRELIELYRDIGRMIVKRQEDYGWGNAIVERLADDIQMNFLALRASPPEISGT